MMSNLKEKKDDKWVILGSNSWIKGTRETVEYANKQNLKYKIISGLSYDQMLKELSASKGLIFMPLGGDTCPRIVIEAKLVGCELILNDNVMHKDEDWFLQEKQRIIEYLKHRPKVFWDIVKQEATA